jgi:putative intracellular protease/amidase
LNSTFEPVDLQEALTSYANAMQMIHGHPVVRLVFRIHATTAITAALATIPALSRETWHLRGLLHLARLDHANLIAAARATVRADHEGEPDPIWYVRDELAARGQLPTDRRWRP